MRFERSLRHLSLCLVVVAAAGCAAERHPFSIEQRQNPTTPTNPTNPTNPTTPGTGTPTAPAPNMTGSFVTLRSDAGESLTGGDDFDYSPENAVLDVTTNGGFFHVAIDGDEEWEVAFQSPASLSRLTKGTYEGLTKYSQGANPPAAGSVQVSGLHKACSSVTGKVTVDSVTYEGDSLTYVRLSVEQHCDGQVPALRATVRWFPNDTVGPLDPRPIPSNLWAPLAGKTPATGDFVYLVSDAGDFIGQGRENLYVETSTPIDVVKEPINATTTAGIRISVEDWDGEFIPMYTLARLEPGYYPFLMRYPFHNPARGGMNWSGQGRGCNTLTGWFAVDAVEYDGTGQMTAISARFEQHCEGGAPALRGRFRWTR